MRSALDRMVDEVEAGRCSLSSPRDGSSAFIPPAWSLRDVLDTETALEAFQNDYEMTEAIVLSVRHDVPDEVLASYSLALDVKPYL